MDAMISDCHIPHTSAVVLFSLSLLACASHVSFTGPTCLLYGWQQALALILACSCRGPEADIDNIQLTTNVSILALCERASRCAPTIDPRLF